MKHKHYDLIVAWAGGDVKIEFESAPNEWVETSDPYWLPITNFRIKQEPKIEVKYFRNVTVGDDNKLIGYSEFTHDLEQWDLKITYQDGEPINFETPKKG